MKLSHVLSRTASTEGLVSRKHVPWTASPLDRRAMSQTELGGMPGESKMDVNNRVVQFDGGHLQHTDTGTPVFREHHESSTIELFYDLFFVANLTTFTANHEILSAESLTSYLGFFTLMWFTWLQTSLFDVRFSSDSVLNRLCKALSFGVMTGFAIVGVLYDPTLLDTSREDNMFLYNANAFRALAIVLMVSRLVLVLQYAVVFWYVKPYPRCKLPLLSTMGALFLAAMVFLGTAWGFPDGRNLHTYVGWYVVIVVEAFTVIAISCIWRVVSFKHTHLVERVGLLTLIIMGEGIIGMTKNVATILQNSVTVSGRTIGSVVSAVLLIYFVWVLYFDQIENDRFGTIRQQIWALLHFPLHVAILFTVEGSAQFITWNIIQENWNWELNNIWPPGYGNDITGKQYVHDLQTNLTLFDDRFKRLSLVDFYDYEANLTKISNLNFTDTDQYNEAYNIYSDIANELVDFIFHNFNIEVPESDSAESTSPADQLVAYQGIFITVFLYFLIAGGCFLIILGIMYWFGKNHKSRWEYSSILIRGLIGTGLALLSTSVLTAGGASLFYSPWTLPLMMLSYLLVIVADNVLVWHTNKTVAHSLQYHRSDSQDDGGQGNSSHSTYESV